MTSVNQYYERLWTLFDFYQNKKIQDKSNIQPVTSIADKKEEKNAGQKAK
jgi:hypothetical protein